MDGVLLLLHDGDDDRQKLSCIPRVAAVAVLVSSPWWQQRTCRLHGVDHSDGERGVSGGVGDVDVDMGRGADRCDRYFHVSGVDHWPMVMSSCHCCFVASLCYSSSNTCSVGQLRKR